MRALASEKKVEASELQGLLRAVEGEAHKLALLFSVRKKTDRCVHRKILEVAPEIDLRVEDIRP